MFSHQIFASVSHGGLYHIAEMIILWSEVSNTNNHVFHSRSEVESIQWKKKKKKQERAGQKLHVPVSKYITHAHKTYHVTTHVKVNVME